MHLEGKLPKELSMLTNLQAASFAGNRFTEIAPELITLKNLVHLDIRRNPISAVPAKLCCQVHGLMTDVQCDASQCSHYGNPWTAAGCHPDEQKFDIPVRASVAVSLCSKACSPTQSCPNDLPPWNPSGSAQCVRTQSGATRCSVLCLVNTHCGHPHGVCIFGILDASVKDSSGRPIGVCAYKQQ